MKTTFYIIITILLVVSLSNTSCQPKDYSAEITALKTSRDSLAAALKITNANLQSTNSTLAGLSTSVISIQAQLAVISGQISTLNSQLTTTNTNVAGQTATIATIQSQIKTIQDQIATLTTQQNTTSSTVTGLSSTMASVQSQIKIIQDQIATLNTQQASTSSTVSGLGTTVTGLGTTIVGLSSTITAIQSQISSILNQVAALNSQQSITTSSLSDMSSKLTLSINQLNSLSLQFSQLLIQLGLVVIDADGNAYLTVTIGTQVWMAENLKTTKYNDGTSIPNVTDKSAWAALSSGAYCYYKNDTLNRDKLGGLYNWYAVNTGKLAPTGWHVPTDAEWTTLTTFLGGVDVAAGKLKVTGTVYWASPNLADNSSGFSARSNGLRSYYQYEFTDANYFSALGSYGTFWSSTQNDTSTAWHRYLYWGNIIVNRGASNKKSGFGVRCIKN